MKVQLIPEQLVAFQLSYNRRPTRKWANGPAQMSPFLKGGEVKRKKEIVRKKGNPRAQLDLAKIDIGNLGRVVIQA